MNCSSCYEIKVECCEDFTLPVKLTAATQYFVVFQKPGKTTIFQKQLTSDSEGNILISKADFPAGYFAVGLFFNIEIRDGADYNTLIPLAFGGETYSCILLETLLINPGFNTSPGNPPGVTSGNYEIIQLNNVSEATVSWTDERQNKFGDFPLTEVWINDAGVIFKTSFQPTIDALPPNMTTMSFDFGGNITGFIIIK